jgi:hypothetical protein
MTYKLNELIHSEEFFAEEYLKSRQKEYGFTQLTKVKTFLWDFELLAQLQRKLGSRVLLKGGAAAQLFFPPEKQRTSVDIDVIYSGNEKEMQQALDSIHSDFGGDEVFFKFTKYNPKKPTKVLPLQTFYVAVPAILAEETYQINIKLDFHMIDDIKVKVIDLKGAVALGVPLAFAPRCLSAESLVGDKLLTLARGSVGIPPGREADIPKQLYDLNVLTSLQSFENLPDLRLAFGEFLQLEISNAGQAIDERTVYTQIIDTLRRYSTVGGNEPDSEALKVLKEFRGNYEPRPFMNMLQWETVCKRLEYFSSCLTGKSGDAILLIKQADDTAAQISSAKDRQSLTKKLFSILQSLSPPGKTGRFRNVTPERIFWEILSLDKTTVEELRHRLAS